MKINRSVSALVVAASVAVAALGLTGAAQAQNVYWSVGVSSPGMQLGVANGPPVMVVQQPMYEPVYQPVYQPVYRAPRPVYVAPPPPPPVVYVQPAPVYMAPPQYIQADWGYPDHGRRWHHGHGHHESERFEHGHGDRHWD